MSFVLGEDTTLTTKANLLLHEEWLQARLLNVLVLRGTWHLKSSHAEMDKKVVADSQKAVQVSPVLS